MGAKYKQWHLTALLQSWYLMLSGVMGPISSTPRSARVAPLAKCTRHLQGEGKDKHHSACGNFQVVGMSAHHRPHPLTLKLTSPIIINSLV